MEAVFANEENTQISWTNEQGQVWSVPYPLADGQIPNQIQSWIDAGNTIAPYAPPALTAADVKAEAQRRICAVFGVTDLTSCIIKQLNAQMRASELINIKAEGGTLTTEQQAEADALQAAADAVKLIRSKSDVIEAMTPIPADYTNDSYWSA
jgi:RNA-binding protein YhbY